MASFFLLIMIPFMAAQGQVVDPVPEPITKSGLSVEIENVIQMPATSNSDPLARINMLKPAWDNSGRLFIHDLRGTLYVLEGDSAVTFLDLKSQRPNFIDSPGLGSGFGMFAFHPDYAGNGKIYTTHTEATGSGEADFDLPAGTDEIRLQWVLSEWTDDNPADNTVTGSSREMLRIDTPRQVHGMQDMSFNPHAAPGSGDYGMLYLCIGDGGTTVARYPGNAHTLISPLGTIIRIDPFGSDSRTGEYGIPADNPFAEASGDTVGEIWAWGFRNPHRFSWDPAGDNKMIIGDIGERNLEELNIGFPGLDYGWNEREGTFAFDYTQRDNVYELPPNDSDFDYVYPAAQYDHDEGFAVVGGYVYRGEDIPQLSGMYVFGDIVNGRVFYVPADSLVNGEPAKISELTLTVDGQAVTLSELVNNSRVDLRFGIDTAGDIYILTKADGVVRKLVPDDTTTVGIASSGNDVPPEGYRLQQNYPNPFNPSTTIRFSLASRSTVQLNIFNANGQLIKSVVNGNLSAGDHEVTWHAANQPSGIYYYRLQTAEGSLSRKMVLLR